MVTGCLPTQAIWGRLSGICFFKTDKTALVNLCPTSNAEDSLFTIRPKGMQSSHLSFLSACSSIEANNEAPNITIGDQDWEWNGLSLIPAIAFLDKLNSVSIHPSYGTPVPLAAESSKAPSSSTSFSGLTSASGRCFFPQLLPTIDT